MVTITDSLLRSNVYETLYDLLKAYATSSSYSTTPQPMVTAAYIDNSTQTFPMIVVNPAIISTEGRTFNNSSSQKNVSVIIDIYTKKTEDIDKLADNIFTLVNGTKTQGITLVGTNETFSVPLVNSTKIKNKTITFNYIRR